MSRYRVRFPAQVSIEVGARDSETALRVHRQLWPRMAERIEENTGVEIEERDAPTIVEPVEEAPVTLAVEVPIQRRLLYGSQEEQEAGIRALAQELWHQFRQTEREAEPGDRIRLER